MVFATSAALSCSCWPHHFEIAITLLKKKNARAHLTKTDLLAVSASHAFYYFKCCKLNTTCTNNRGNSGHSVCAILPPPIVQTLVDKTYTIGSTKDTLHSCRAAQQSAQLHDAHSSFKLLLCAVPSVQGSRTAVISLLTYAEQTTGCTVPPTQLQSCTAICTAARCTFELQIIAVCCTFS